MQAIWNAKGEKLHTRNVEVTIYDCAGQGIIVEGFLKDTRTHDTPVIPRETYLNGVVHHMGIRLLVNSSNLLIEDVDVDLIALPREFCREAIECLVPIKGLTITRGFMAKVKIIAGGNKGCTHLIELLQVMAQTTVQGIAAYRALKPSGSVTHNIKDIFNRVFNTCVCWRENGPFVERVKKMIDE